MRACLTGSAALALLTLTPSVAVACPYCAGQAGGGPFRSIALGALLLLPFLVVAAILKVIRSEPMSGQRALAEADAGDAGPGSASRDASRRAGE